MLRNLQQVGHFGLGDGKMEPAGFIRLDVIADNFFGRAVGQSCTC